MSDKSPIIIKKVKKGGDGHHGGSWKVALADFMTAMMAFFLVMWVIGLDQDTRALIAGYFRDPLNFMKQQEGSKLDSVLPANPPSHLTEESKTISSMSQEQMEKEKDEIDKLQQQIQDEISKDPNLQSLAKYVRAQETEEGLVIEFMEGLGSVFFELGSAKITPDARKLFIKLGRVLAESNRVIVVDGHTDAKPYSQGANYDNWDLSQDRAIALFKVIRTAGVNDNNVLAIRGFADKRLRNKEDPYHFSNRRVTVLLPYKWKEEQVVGSAGELFNPVPLNIVPDIRQGQ